jgi:hypothetical protein
MYTVGESEDLLLYAAKLANVNLPCLSRMSDCASLHANKLTKLDKPVDIRRQEANTTDTLEYSAVKQGIYCRELIMEFPTHMFYRRCECLSVIIDKSHQLWESIART